MIELEKDLEFNNCVNKEIKQSVKHDVKETWKAIKDIGEGIWAGLKWILKWGAIACAIFIIAEIAVLLFGNMVMTGYNRLDDILQGIISEIQAHYMLVGLSTIGVGILTFCASIGLIYYSTKLEDAIRDCEYKWKEHGLQVDKIKLDNLNNKKEKWILIGIIMAFIAICVAICGGILACYEITAIILVCVFILCALIAMFTSTPYDI